MKILLTNCTVEFSLPSSLESVESLKLSESKVKFSFIKELEDFIVITAPDGRRITVNKFQMEGIIGTMLPTVGTDGVVRWFTYEDKKEPV